MIQKTSKKNKSILVWAMKITDTENTKNFYDFSCQANTYSVLQIESKQVKKELKFIIPDTDTEKVFDAVCKK